MWIHDAPTPKPEIPIEGVEMIIPLICIAVFLLLVVVMLMRFFFFMTSDRKEDVEKQEAMYRSPRLRKEAERGLNGLSSPFPKTYGGNAWASWRKDLPGAPKESIPENTELLDDDP